VAASDRRRPRALDVGEDGADVEIAENSSVSRHVGVVRIASDGSWAVFREPHEQLVGMMMGVPTLVVWRCRESTVGAPSPPVALALELSSVARSALGRIDLGASLYELLVAGIEPFLECRSLRDSHIDQNRQYNGGRPDTHTESASLRHRFVSTR